MYLQPNIMANPAAKKNKANIYGCILFDLGVDCVGCLAVILKHVFLVLACVALSDCFFPGQGPASV